MTITIQAIYEDGVLRPLTPLALSQGQQVRVTVASEEGIQAQHVASVLADIAALPVEGSGNPFTSREHDRVLYGD